ncbi:MAG: hypothetical protein AUJ71_01075 [Candidatus Omnitrophica bacterium CG1_02_49_16]|nr:MAG: hypothetical protein AUJ71_01075 [Candidatus Omnitrophica bacterium CG1_02_49_16]
MAKKWLINIAVTVVTLLVLLGSFEGVLRIREVRLSRHLNQGVGNTAIPDQEAARKAELELLIKDKGSATKLSISTILALHRCWAGQK